MKLLLGLILGLGFTAHAVASPIPPVTRFFSDRLPQGTGFDRETIQNFGDTDDFESGLYYLRVDVSERRLVNYRLPRTTFTHYCGYYRTSGGSVGDYKPKNIADRVGVRNPWDGGVYNLSWEGILGADYNETPVVKTYEYHPRGATLSAGAPTSVQMNILVNACRHVRPVPKVTIVWDSFFQCRWKPELWHKPSTFRDEYTPPLLASIEQEVVLHCVNF